MAAQLKFIVIRGSEGVTVIIAAKSDLTLLPKNPSVFDRGTGSTVSLRQDGSWDFVSE